MKKLFLKYRSKAIKCLFDFVGRYYNRWYLQYIIKEAWTNSNIPKPIFTFLDLYVSKEAFDAMEEWGKEVVEDLKKESKHAKPD